MSVSYCACPDSEKQIILGEECRFAVEPGLVAVSPRGIVWRRDSKFSTHWKKVHQFMHHGYPVVTLKAGGKKKTFPVHTLVAEAFLGPRPANAVIVHKDAIPVINCVCNLEYCTPAEARYHAAALKHNRDVLLAWPIQLSAAGLQSMEQAIEQLKAIIPGIELLPGYAATCHCSCHGLTVYELARMSELPEAERQPIGVYPPPGEMLPVEE